jgi:hypothetical protein
MSLIQEALKRQQEEARKLTASLEPPVVQQPPGQEPPVARTASGLQVASSPPPPVPEEGTVPPPEEEPKKHSKFADKRVLRLVLSIIPIALILLGGGFWIAKSMLSAKPPQAAPSTKPRVQIPPQTTAQPVNPPSATEIPAPPKPGALQPTAVAAPLPASTSQTAAVSSAAQPKATSLPTPESAAPAATQKQAEATGTLPGTNEAPAAVVEQPKPAPPPAPLVWPVLTVSGVMGKGTKGAAKINNIIVEVGQEIDDVRLVAIGVQSVQLEYKGHERTVKVGRSTQ